VTATLHWAVLTGSTVGQVTVQPEVAATTFVDAEPELSAACGSLVVLVTLAVSVMIVPFGVPEFTLKTKSNIAVVLAGKLATVQLIVPDPLPEDGVVLANAES
jgi:hypothetical protein